MSKRHAGIDLLRIVSVFLVLILHTLGQGGVLPTDLAARLTELAGREEGAERVPPEVGPDTSVSALLRRYPDAAAVLMKNGLSCVGCTAASMETLGSGALNHGIDLEQLLRDLEELL